MKKRKIEQVVVVGGGFEKERDRSLLLKPQISPYHAKKQQRRVLGGVEAIF